MRRERRELSLELGDARGQRVALSLERLAVARAHHHNLRLAPRFLNVGVGHGLLLLAAYDLEIKFRTPHAIDATSSP